MNNHMQMSGKIFWKKLRKSSIPASVFAMKAKCSLESVYQLKEREQVPAKFVQILVELCNKPAPEMAA